MSFYNVFFIAVGLAMDAFAVAVTDGMKYKQKGTKLFFVIALAFGFFQGIMPIIGWFLSSLFFDYITLIPHWITLIILSFLGIKMIIDAIKVDFNNKLKKVSFNLILFQAIATSIDALAVGISFQGFNYNMISMINVGTIIMVTTLIISFVGSLIGKMFGSFLKDKAEIFGGIMLIIIGIKIFFEHIFS